MFRVVDAATETERTNEGASSARRKQIFCTRFSLSGITEKTLTDIRCGTNIRPIKVPNTVTWLPESDIAGNTFCRIIPQSNLPNCVTRIRVHVPRGGFDGDTQTDVQVNFALSPLGQTTSSLPYCYSAMCRNTRQLLRHFKFVVYQHVQAQTG